MKQRVALGIGLSGTIATLAYWRRSFTRSGGAGTVLLGTMIYSFGGLALGAALTLREPPKNAPPA